MAYYAALVHPVAISIPDERRRHHRRQQRGGGGAELGDSGYGDGGLPGKAPGGANGQQLLSSSGGSSEEGEESFMSMSRRKKLTVVNFCTTNLFVGCFYSLLGPFFPTEVS